MKGQFVALIVLVVGGLLSLGYLYVTESPDVAFEEIPYFSGALFGAVGALLLFFLWNLACAPYRIERDARLALEIENTELKSRALPKKRSLSEIQKAQLAQALQNADLKVKSLNVLYYNASEECADFAADIGDAIKAAGIECSVHDGVMFRSDPRLRGLKVFHGGSPLAIRDAEKVVQALVEIGFMPEQLAADSKNSDFCFFYAARQSGQE
jgi:hypothetical protein